MAELDMLPFDLHGTPPTALRALADYLSQLAERIRKHADHVDHEAVEEQHASLRFERARTEFREIGDMVATHVEHGATSQAAVHLIAAATGRTAEQVQFAWSVHQRLRRENRRTVIDWLKAKGWTDAEIAPVVDMHEKSITRLRNNER